MSFLTRVLAAAAVALLSLLGVAGVATAAPPTRDETTILVKFSLPNGKLTVGTQVAELKTKTIIVKVPKSMNVDKLVALYRSLPFVTYAEPNYIAQTTLVAPNDPFFADQWGLQRVHALDGWATYPGKLAAGGAPIAIVDSGVEGTHPDLVGKITSSVNCTNGTCVPAPATDDDGHGTAIAGVAAAITNNGQGVAGLAPGAPLLAAKVLDAAGSGTYAAIAAGIIWAADNGARVINLSVTGPSQSQTLCDAVAYATGKGALVAAAAGNNGSSDPVYPAACPGAVGVASTASDDSTPSWSDTGAPDVFVSAPGLSIHTTYLNGTYALVTGTSISVPFVSGLASLLFAQTPARSVADVRRIIAASAAKVGGDSYGADPYQTCTGCTWSAGHGYGLIDVDRALKAGAVDPVAPSTPVQQQQPPATTQPETQTPAQAASPGSDFSIAAQPVGGPVVQGQQTTFKILVQGRRSFAGSVALEATGLPAGTSASFSPESVSAAGSSTLTVTTTGATPAGSYILTIHGTSDALAHTTPAQLVVTAPVQGSTTASADFLLSAQPSGGPVTPGQQTTFTVSVRGRKGFTGSVALEATGLPAGASASFSPESVTASGSSTLTVTTTGATPAGGYTMTIRGTSGTLARTTATMLVVTAPRAPAPAPAGSFAITVTPASRIVKRGSSAVITVRVTGATAPDLSVDGLPNGVTASFQQTTRAGTWTLRLDADTTATRFTTTPLTITAVSDGVTKTANATLIVM